MAYDFTDKIALVTGASRGIGRAIALELAKKGAHVIALAKTKAALEELDDEINAAGGTATLIPFDLRKEKDLLGLGPQLAEKFGRLDILVANAGLLGPLCPMPHLKPHDFDSVMSVNLIANHRLLITLDPLLKAADAGRALFVTSGVTKMESPYWAAYGISKAALDKMVESYAAENTVDGYKINLFDPGVAATAMRAKAFPGEDPNALSSPEEVAKSLIQTLETDQFSNGDRIAA